MPKRSSTSDPNVSAFNIVRDAVGETPDTGPEAFAALIREVAAGIEEGVSPEHLARAFWPRIRDMVSAGGAAELGRKGGKKGGRARADTLTPEQRSAIARRAARARWDKEGTGG